MKRTRQPSDSQGALIEVITLVFVVIAIIMALGGFMLAVQTGGHF